MYESLVLGRSLKMYRVIFFLKNIFLQIFPTVMGSMSNTLQQCRDLACIQEEHGNIGTPWHIKRGRSFRNFSRHSGGVWTTKEENILVRPLPLMSKGERDLVLLPSSPKGEIVGIMMHVSTISENQPQI